ncbi:hypothetical protein EON64_10090 [archaeon]|nr:MAG: hypothetical protein EON64_10090 [archaeon]
MSNTFNEEYLNWTCPACADSMLINPDEPEFYCSRRCDKAAGEAVTSLLSPSSQASRPLVRQLRLFFLSRHEFVDADERGRLAQAWACRIIEDMEYIGELTDAGVDVESIVMNWKKN